MIILLFIIPVTMPENNSWLTWADFPPTILNGGSSFTDFTSDDWNEAMLWIKQNTPENAIIASWWDYGYWITTLSERTTIVDNATLIDWQIKKMAYALVTTPENSWNILHSDFNTNISSSLSSKFLDPTFLDSPNFTPEDQPDCISPKNDLVGNPTNYCNPIIRGLDADYLLIYLVGERFSTQNSNLPLYTLEGGGDESKKTWFAKISNHQVSKMIENDNITPTKFYMENTTLGMLTPFTIFKYVEPNTGRTFDKYQKWFNPCLRK